MRALIGIVMLFFFIQTNAQNTSTAKQQAKDVIYLKNKKIYSGTILSDEMGVVKLLTTDDKGKETTLLFQHFEIKKIEKASSSPSTITESQSPLSLSLDPSSTVDPVGVKQSANSDILMERDVITKVDPSLTFDQSFAFQPKLVQKGGGMADYDNPFKPLLRRRMPKIWVRDIVGFRGFMEAGYMFGMGKIKYSYVEISKSVGYQFTPNFYLGAGATYHMGTNKDIDASSIPVFLNSRFNLTDRNTWNPFISLKVGYGLGDLTGFNPSVTAGTSIVLKNKKLAFNIGVSYSFFDAHYKMWDNSSKKLIKYTPDFHSIGIKLEFEYGF